MDRKVIIENVDLLTGLEEKGELTLGGKDRVKVPCLLVGNKLILAGNKKGPITRLYPVVVCEADSATGEIVVRIDDSFGFAKAYEAISNGGKARRRIWPANHWISWFRGTNVGPFHLAAGHGASTWQPEQEDVAAEDWGLAGIVESYEKA